MAASMHASDRLGRLLRPASVAVVGGDEASRAAEQCLRMGFAGALWPVNATRASMAERPCYRRVADLPAPPDAVFVAVPAEATIDIVAQLAAMDAGGAVCYASGFKEVGGEGIERQRRLIAAAGSMPIIGPNCYGLLNYLDGVALWPDQHGGEPVGRGAAIVTQSGNIGLNFTMHRRALPLAYVVAVGNQAAIGVEDCLAAMLDDPRVTAIGLHFEGVVRLERFVAGAQRARRNGVPLVVLKTGRSRGGARIAMSHTASLAGDDGLFDALFARLGIVRARTVETFLETLKFLSVIGPLQGNRVASLSCSGGEASLIADLADGRDLLFPEMEPQHRSAVAAALHNNVCVDNPLDYHTYIWGDEARLTQCFTAMMEGHYDLCMLLLDYPRSDRCRMDDWWPTTNAIVQAAKATGARAAVVASLPECLPEEMAKMLSAHGLAPMHGFEQALAAVEGAVLAGRARAADSATPVIAPVTVAGRPRVHDERESKRALEALGLTVPEGRLVATVDEAVTAAEGIGYPVVVKAVGGGIVHKTEAGGVSIDLHSPGAVASAARRLHRDGRQLLVERMIGDAVLELIVGVGRDEQFGPYLVLGRGGVLVELIRDTRVLLLPVDRSMVLDTLQRLAMAPLFEGYRGLPAADLDAVVDAVIRLARFAQDNAARLMELDINPLLVRPRGKGAVVADAHMITLETNPED